MKPTKKPLVVGVTGIMGAGKTTVAKVFEEMGAVLIDADAMGKAMLGEPEIRGALVTAFGAGITGAGGRIDGAKLGRAAFASGASARKLDALTREPLIARIRARIEEVRESADVIVVDAALLPEWKAGAWLDVLVVVDAEEGRARERLAAGSRFSDADVRARMQHQISRAEKAGAADIVIPNHGSLEDLRARARAVYGALLAGDGAGGTGRKER
jgi:dephospho-CoA kinase